MATINNHQVSLVSGETGSGKTTQVIIDLCYCERLKLVKMTEISCCPVSGQSELALANPH